MQKYCTKKSDVFFWFISDLHERYVFLKEEEDKRPCHMMHESRCESENRVLRRSLQTESSRSVGLWECTRLSSSEADLGAVDRLLQFQTEKVQGV